MNIVVFAERYEKGAWRDWEHVCNREEVDAVIDSAKAKASDRLHLSDPFPIDFLLGARYIFNVAYGSSDRPDEGDTTIYAVAVEGTLIGHFQKVKQHFQLKMSAA